jgi:hypothetical protein
LIMQTPTEVCSAKRVSWWGSESPGIIPMLFQDSETFVAVYMCKLHLVAVSHPQTASLHTQTATKVLLS